MSTNYFNADLRIKFVKAITAFAPATVANVAVGFDILGFALATPGDRITVRKTDDVTSILSVSDDAIPLNPKQNTAGYALLKMGEELNLDFGFEIVIEKGIPVGSGLGGSASSAVGAVVAANELLETPLPKEELFRFALYGESIASGGTLHGDNVAPCLFGGFTLCLKNPEHNFEVIQLPPPPFEVLMVHPKTVVETKHARSVLSPTIPLDLHVQQSMNLAKFIAACYTKDFSHLHLYLKDEIIEEQRRHLVPNFNDITQIIREAGAVGTSISGAGPSIFGLFEERSDAELALQKIEGKYSKHNLTAWTTKINTLGATVIERSVK